MNTYVGTNEVAETFLRSYYKKNRVYLRTIKQIGDEEEFRKDLWVNNGLHLTSTQIQEILYSGNYKFEEGSEKGDDNKTIAGIKIKIETKTSSMESHYSFPLPNSMK